MGNVSLRQPVRSFSLRAMSFLRSSLLLICLAVAGCHPGSQGVIDEQKEPYFLAAKKRNQEKDPAGAIEYFEKALDVNPRSASAHAELGMLYEKLDPQPDFAAALYHYKRALDIRPDIASADLYRMRMEDCKRELAKSVVQLPTMEAMQKKIDALTIKNQQLEMQLQAATRGLPYSNTPAAVPQPTPAPPTNFARANPSPAAPRNDLTTNIRPKPMLPTATSGGARVHIVASGETLGAIARRYNIRLSALQAANPTVDARKMRAGQTLVIPPAQ